VARKKAVGVRSRPSRADAVARFIRGDIVDRHLNDLMQHSSGLQLLARKKPWDPKPSVGACTPKNICTASILCLLTIGPGRVGCGKTEILNPNCPIVKL
jgi:hypothetical protein